MKYDNNVIKDLLPLYIDDVLSDTSRQIVDEHLDECEDCRKYLNDLKESNKIELNITDTELEKEHADILKLMRKKIVRRNIIISLLSIFIVISIFSLSLFYLKNTAEYLDVNQLKVEEKGNDLILEIEHAVWNQISQVRFTLSENGKEYDFTKEVTSDISLYAYWSKIGDKTNEDVDKNSKTGDILIFIAWTAGIGALTYSVYYFKSRKETI